MYELRNNSVLGLGVKSWTLEGDFSNLSTNNKDLDKIQDKAARIVTGATKL